jgi:4-hydroxy-tetrahydrodipicolinate reductase
MGCRLVALAAERPDLRLVGALEVTGHPAVGRDAGIVAGCGETRIQVTSDIGRVLAEAQVLIDFSSVTALPAHIDAAVERGVGLVIGTTGLTSEHESLLLAAAARIPLIAAPNMSVGVNLLFEIAPLVTRALGEAYDIEIVEAHHNKKKDAPSGTALRILDLVLEARGRDRADAVFGREGAAATRRAGEIGVHAVRAGDIVGDHTIHFVADGERIELTHRASTRDTFAIGALRAARWLGGRPAGRYTMKDVLVSD